MLQRTNGKTKKKQDAVPGPEDGKHQADYRVGKTGGRGGKRRKTVQSSATCGDRRQWCLGSEKPIVPSHAWQNNVKASVDNTWQISPFRRMLLVGAFVLDGTNGYHGESFSVSSDNQNTGLRHREGEWMPKYNTGPISHNDEPQAGQMNFTQDSLEALHRRVLSGHKVIPEAVA